MKTVKRKICFGILMLLALCITACGKENKTEDRSISAQEADLKEKESENTGSSGIPIRIYHSDDTAEILRVSKARTEEITPEILLLNLSLYHMVPDTVSVESFDQKKQESGLLLTLDLSEEFEEYLTGLDASVEEGVMGSVVNTFLDAYRGETILITVQGEALSTAHEDYTQAQKLYPYQEASYEIVAETLAQTGISISYPQIAELSDGEVQEKWNEIIEGHARTALEQTEEGGSLEVSYKIKTMNDQLLSILIEGSYSRPGGPYPTVFRYTYNIDVNSGESVRLAYYQDVERLAENLLSGKGYTVEGELGEELTERLSILYGNQEQLADTLRNFDYGENRETPSGFSYHENGKVHLCIAVPHALGDYADVILDPKQE